jgi:DNA-binding transcriptional MerR regulator
MEFQILQVLKQAAGTKFSYKEIGKIVDRREFRENPHWARTFLELLVFEQLIWKEEALYLYPTEEQQKAESERRAKENYHNSQTQRLVEVN